LSRASTTNDADILLENGCLEACAFCIGRFCYDAKKWTEASVEDKAGVFSRVKWPVGADAALVSMMKIAVNNCADQIGTPRYVN
jgi:hypothetical protein